jgi:hypothetical protein
LSYIFALLSVLFLLPFILFLKIGYSKKGKIIILSCSLLIAMLTLLAQINYPFWQVVLISVFLVIIMSYVLYERYERVIFKTNNNKFTNNINQNINVRKEVDESLFNFDEESSLDDYKDLKEEQVFIKEELEEQPQNTLEPIVEMNFINMEQHDNNDFIEEIEINDYPIETTELIPLTFENKLEAKLEDNIEETYLDDNEIKLNEIDVINEIDAKKLSGMDEIDKIDITDEAEMTYLEEIDMTDIPDNQSHPNEEVIPISKKVDPKIKKEAPMKRENYLSEIERLLEED